MLSLNSSTSNFSFVQPRQVEVIMGAINSAHSRHSAFWVASGGAGGGPSFARTAVPEGSHQDAMDVTASATLPELL